MTNTKKILTVATTTVLGGLTFAALTKKKTTNFLKSNRKLVRKSSEEHQLFV